MSMTLEQIQQYAHDLSHSNGWDKECIDTRISYLKEEVVEAIKEVEQLKTEQDPEKISELKENLGLELFDIIWNAAEIANRFNIDLTEAAVKKIVRNQNRSFSEKPQTIEMEVVQNG